MDVLDEQSQHAAAFAEGGGLCPGVQVSEDPVQAGGQGEVGLAVGALGVEGLDLVAQVGFRRR